MLKKQLTLKAAIIAIGDELMDKQADTNSLVFTAQLEKLGITVEKKVIVPDELPLIIKTLRGLSQTYPLVLCSGGLGPTQDDVTRQAVAAVMQQPLVVDKKTLNDMRLRFKKTGYAMPSSNKQQALLPKTAKLLPNAHGTAPGFFGYHNNHFIAALPGPPHECIPMLQGSLTRLLKKEVHLGKQVILKKEISVCGVPESLLQQKLGPVFENMKEIKLGFLIQEPGEILVKLMCVDKSPKSAQSSMRQAITKVKKTLGSDIVDKLGESLPVVLGKLLTQRKQTVALAESCTGGLISSRLTSMPGSSAYFLEGAVTYSNDAKKRTLQVPMTVIKKYGAVSEQVAKKMAQGIRHRASSDWGVAVTGIAGPGGGTKEKPVGLVHMAVAGPEGLLKHKVLNFVSSRNIIQRLTASIALDLLRRSILGIN